jgi:membrane-associated protein
MFDVEAIVGAGIFVIAAVIFAESGLLIGFFLPGDTLLFSAGLIAASQGDINLTVLILVTSLAAIIGDNVGYSIGRRAGPRIFKKEDGILFHQEHLRRAEAFYEKHGGKTITIARFVPMVRTFAPVVAGAGKMPRRRFMMYNITGGVFWCASMILLGYWLGSKIPGLDHYIEYVLIGVVVISLLAAFGHLLRDAKTRAAMWAGLKNQASKIALNKKVN